MVNCVIGRKWLECDVEAVRKSEEIGMVLDVNGAKSDKADY